MSGTRYHHPPPPWQVPQSGSLDERFAAVAIEMNKKAYSGLAGPAFRFIGMIAPDGSTWRLYIDNAGNLHTEQVQR